MAKGALIAEERKAGTDITPTPRLESIPFDSPHQYMATLHEGGLVYVKGAAEVLLDNCGGGLDAQESLWSVLQINSALRWKRWLRAACASWPSPASTSPGR